MIDALYTSLDEDQSGKIDMAELKASLKSMQAIP